ncbi:MAG: ClC family H(+)/Cl(-) exchange transporter [Acidaminococcaceae bacterium]|nr:ClC family H(+)/Cl(-) exchange transporter [Acidaminococcaceae bacterium]
MTWLQKLRFHSGQNENSAGSSSAQIRHTYHSLNHWQGFQFKLFWEGVIVGIFSGLVVSLFRYSLVTAEKYRLALYAQLSQLPAVYTAGWFAALLVIGWILCWLTKHEPMAGGSGIVQVKGAILGFMRMNWFRILWVKIVGAVIALGAGLSLGRGGPSIQLGAVAAQGVSRLLGRSRMEERYLITSGASAGLAVAFNAPLAGVMFSLEELHRNFSAVVLLPAMTAAMTATFVSRLLLGRSLVFTFYTVPYFPLDIHLLYAILVAIIAGLGGVLFNAGLLNIQKFYSLPVFKNLYLKIVFTLLCAGILGFYLPQILGGGNLLADELVLKIFPLYPLLLLLAGKFIFTLLCCGTGVPGGFFLPMLVLGSLTGSVCATLLTSFQLILPGNAVNFVIIAMAAFFTASVRAPITGTVLISEMTGSFSHLMILGMASAIAYIVAQLCGSQPIYEAMLLRSLESRSTPEPDTVKKERNIVEVPVSSGSMIENKKVKDIPWPAHTLLVDVKRGSRQLIPESSTVIRAGDFLYVLAETENAEEVQNLGSDLRNRM